MSGFRAFFSKELLEIIRTWRLWVLPGILLFMGLTSPLMAQLAPTLLKSLASEQPGLVIQIPEPTHLDAYAQWLKNLSQIVLFALLISASGVVSSELKSGTAILVLTKPISRAAFVIAKVVSGLLLLTASTLLGMLLCWLVSLLLFGEAPLLPLFFGTALWWGYASMWLCVVTLLSTRIEGQAGAAGVALGLYLFSSVLGLWGPALRYSPVGLPALAAAALIGAPTEPLWPALSCLLLGILAAFTATRLFSTREL